MTGLHVVPDAPPAPAPPRPEPADIAAYLDTLPWWVVAGCSRCHARDLDVTVAGHIEAASGPGYELLFCRACMARLLGWERARARAAGEPFQPELMLQRDRTALAVRMLDAHLTLWLRRHATTTTDHAEPS